MVAYAASDALFVQQLLEVVAGVLGKRWFSTRLTVSTRNSQTGILELTRFRGHIMLCVQGVLNHEQN